MSLGMIIIIILGLSVVVGGIYIITKSDQSNVVSTLSTPSKTACLPGNYMKNDRCTKCPVGTYSALSGSTFCTKCPEGTMSLQEGSSKCTRICSTGYIYNTITKNCDPCKVGEFQTMNTCMPCPICQSSLEASATCPIYTCQEECLTLTCNSNQDFDKAQCKCVDRIPVNTCPSGSSKSMLDVAEAVPGYIGCYCDLGKIWNGSSCVVDCPSGSSRTITTKPILGHTGCYCDVDKAWDYSNKLCIHTSDGCPINSTSITLDKSVPAGIHNDCYCLDNTIWDPIIDACYGQLCPPYTSTKFKGDPIIGNINCKCPSHSYWKDNKCNLCPFDSFIGYPGLSIIDSSRFGNCACPINYEWNESLQSCVSTCPNNSSKYSTTPVGLDATDKPGCYCDRYTTWLDGSCQNCPDVSSPDFQGMSVGFGTCKCYGSYYNERCMQCKNSISQSFNGLGEQDTETGCRCRSETDMLSSDKNYCLTCPFSSGTGINYTGKSHNIYPSCKCPTGQGWSNSLYSTCVNYESDGCPSNSSLNGQGPFIGSFAPECKCNSLNSYVNNFSNCVNCPGNTLVTNTGPSVIGDCKCPNGTLWNGIDKICQFNPCYNIPYSSTTISSNPIPNTPCYCDVGLWWNNIECVPENSPEGR